jgi:hypothetical protein
MAASSGSDIARTHTSLEAKQALIRGSLTGLLTWSVRIFSFICLRGGGIVLTQSYSGEDSGSSALFRGLRPIWFEKVSKNKAQGIDP